MKRDRSQEFDAGNRRAAVVILSDPEAHPVCLREWAKKRWQDSHPQVVRRWQHVPTVADGGKVQRSGEQMGLEFEKTEAA